MYKVYSAQWCNYCKKLKGFMDDAGIEYEEIDIDEDLEAGMFLLEKDHRTIPQVYKDGVSVGGYSDFITLHS